MLVAVLKSCHVLCRQATGQATTGNQESTADVDSQSAGSFNNSNHDTGGAEAEQSAQSQVSSQAFPDEDLMAVAEERLMQAEQRALRAEEATQVSLYVVPLLTVYKRHRCGVITQVYWAVL